MASGWIPDPSEHAGAAGWVAFVITIVGGWWKARLRVRADKREDREAEASSEANVAATEVHLAVIEQLRASVAAMSSDFDALRRALSRTQSERDEALMRAWAAESNVARLTARVGVLEDRVRQLESGAGK